MNDWLSRIPLYWAVVVAVALFAGIAVWAWFRPASYIYAGAPDRARWRDLRIWATVLMLIQIVLYVIFG